MYYVYVIKSKLNDQTYVGLTKDLKKRLIEHNEGGVFSTKRYKPWYVIYYEAYLYESLARMREKKLKYNGNAIRELKKRISLFKNIKSGAGFTLIELLAVMVVLVVVGAIIVQILYSTIRGSGKTNLITQIRQNGNFTISQMVKIIRDAKSFDGMGINLDGSDLTYNCTQASVGNGTPTPAPTEYKYIKVTSVSGGQAVFICCENTIPWTIASNSGTLACPGTSLLDTTAIALNSCSFSCSQNNFTDSPTIGIEFSLIQQGSSNLPESTSKPVYFNTSVSMRNLSR